MMVKKMFVMLDVVAAETHPPFLANNDAQALRMRQNALKDVPEAQQADFEMYCIGWYDMVTMELEGSQPLLINVALIEEEQASA